MIQGSLFAIAARESLLTTESAIDGVVPDIANL
jgi:hypothetical protein